MKRVLFVLCCLAAVSCTQSTLLDENFPEDSKSQPVHMTASIRGSETRAELDETLGNGVFTEGDVFGLYVKKEGASTPVCSNETYLLKNAKWGPADSGKDSLFWNVLGIDKPHTFTACYPLQRVTAIEAHPFSVKNNQSGAVNYQNSDLLQATAQAQGGQVDLRFTHRMSRLVICVMTDSITSIKTVKNLNTSCTANLLTGETVSPGNPQDITPKQWTRIPSAGIPTGTKTVYEVLIPAQSLTNTIANRLNLLEVGTKTSAGTIVVQAPLTIKTTDDKEIPFDRLEADHQILLQATIQDHKVVLSAAQIQPWGIGGEADNGIRSYIGIATMQDLLDLGEYTVQYGGGYNLPAAIKDRFVEPGSDAILFWNDLNFDAESNSKYRSKIMTHIGYMLNGQNHTVRGLVGAFCKGDLRIRDFTFENGTGNYNIYRSGLLTTDPCSVWARNCTLKNCSASGSYGSIGLFTGHGGLDLDSCLVLNSSVSGGREPMGLLIGLSTNATIRNTGIINCSASGGGQVGLFAAHVNLSLLNCYAINSRVSGGTTGLFAKSCGNAQNCYAIGSTPSVLFNDISGTMKNVFYEEGARLTNGGAAAQTNVCAFNPVSGKLINPPEGCPDMLLKALNSYAGIGSSYQPWTEYWFNYVGIDQQARATLLPAFKQ